MYRPTKTLSIVLQHADCIQCTGTCIKEDKRNQPILLQSCHQAKPIECFTTVDDVIDIPTCLRTCKLLNQVLNSFLTSSPTFHNSQL